MWALAHPDMQLLSRIHLLMSIACTDLSPSSLKQVELVMTSYAHRFHSLGSPSHFPGMSKVCLTRAVLLQVDTMLLVLDLNLQQDGSIHQASKESSAVAIHYPVIGLLNAIAPQNST